MKLDKTTMLIAFGVITYFLLQFYKEYARNKAVSDANQQEYDEYANTQYLNMTKPHEYKDWEIMINHMFDPGNLFGFR